MSEIINYIKSCYKPKSNREFLELFPFDFKLDIILEMVNDGIFVIYSCNSDIQNTLNRFLDQIEFIVLDDILIGRRTIKQIQWLTNGKIEFPENNNYLFQRLHPNLFNPPKYETVNHTFIISELIKSTHTTVDNLYIEFGTRTNENFNTISKLVTRSIGVDMQPINSHPDVFVSTTDYFSEFTLPIIIKDTFKIENFRPRFNYAFIDADHSFKSTYKDFENLFRYLENGGFIILHDVYPCELHFLNQNACNDCYITPLMIKKHYSQYINILTLPLNPGLCIVQKK
jgi:hypothetical protein